MRVLALGCILVLGFIALAGCSGKSTDSSTSDTTAVTSGSVSERSSGAPGNHPPTGGVTASVVKGTAPLKVTFSLDGSDADKDPLTYALDVNGDGKVDSSGAKLPAKFNYTYSTPGTFNVTYKLSDGKADVKYPPLPIQVQPNAQAGILLFKDDAESGPDAWNIVSETVADPSFCVVEQGTGQAHPLGPWFQDSAQFHSGTKSWHAHYPDEYLSTMTLKNPITLPDGGATVTFWLKGGAEDNSCDGLYVNTGPDAGSLENQIFQAAVYGDWTQFSFHVDASGPLIMQFLFKSDASCSSEPTSVPGLTGTVCGGGYDAGGYWVDDITVA